jgi:hypothetical protein
MDKKYFHELTDEEYKELIIDKSLTINDVMEQFSQPDWCTYPGALRGEMGCWSLIDRQVINREYCEKCECYHERLSDKETT